jgi:cell division protein ZapA (FtsZ GTPase activity inhibitor)
MAALDLADELTALRKKLDEAQRDASQRVAEADARARRAEQVAREAIAEVLTDIDRAIASDDALVAARAADGAA